MSSKIVKSLALTFLVSSILSWLTYDGATVKSFALWLVIYTIIQFFCHTVFTTCSDFFLVKKLHTQAIEKYNKQLQTSASFSCPCPEKITQLVSLTLSEKNVYTCDKCNKAIGVNISMDNALVTTPVDTAITNVNKLVQGFDGELKLND